MELLLIARNKRKGAGVNAKPRTIWSHKPGNRREMASERIVFDSTFGLATTGLRAEGSPVFGGNCLSGLSTPDAELAQKVYPGVDVTLKTIAAKGIDFLRRYLINLMELIPFE